MAFVPENFLMSEAALDKISEEATQHISLLDGAIKSMNLAVTRLQAMPADWTPAATFIDDQVTANPSDEEWLSMQVRKDKLTVDFLAMRDMAIAVKDAATAAR